MEDGVLLGLVSISMLNNPAMFISWLSHMNMWGVSACTCERERERERASKRELFLIAVFYYLLCWSIGKHLYKDMSYYIF